MGADLQDSFEDENKINNKHYQIKFLKNTGILILLISEDIIKLI